jgi:molybdopterin molybdotransferase
MITIEEAKTRINNNTLTLKEERLALTDSLGFVLSKDIFSAINLPSFDQSAMDGYAVCFSDQIATSFKLVAEVKTGDTKLIQLKKGECARIFTGAMIPKGTKAVVMQEKVSIKGQNITIEKHPSLGDNIREVGEQIRKNDKALSQGTIINAAGIGLLSALGVTDINVYQKPTISIIVTGNELIPPSEKLEQGKIYESNSQMLSSALKTSGYTTHFVFNNRLFIYLLNL